MASSRSLSLTEELEKLEQSITLTLQEIDHNFSKSHRIVTTSILPLIELYGEHSAAVWQASKFWKQFFESSANVSLSGYEELANEQSDLPEGDTTTKDESTVEFESQTSIGDVKREVKEEEDIEGGTGREFDVQQSLMQVDDSLLDNGDVSGSTPRPPRDMRSSRIHLSMSRESPYETLRREMRDEEEGGLNQDDDSEDDDNDDVEQDSTIIFEQRTQRLRDMTSMTPLAAKSGPRDEEPQTARQQQDPLLHRVLDRAYRLQTTHHKPQIRVSPLKSTTSQPRREAWQDSPMSSPEMAVPTLRSEAFFSPLRNTAARARMASAFAEPRTPGISVQTPRTNKKSRDLLATGNKGIKIEPSHATSHGTQKHEIDWNSDSDEGDLYGMSPPKTIQFAFPPSKLTQTPAREASKRIVESILFTAGAEHEISEEGSPSMVKMNEDIIDDSF